MTAYDWPCVECYPPVKHGKLENPSYIDRQVVTPPLKNISQIGSSFQLLGKIKAMFQTTNQIDDSPIKTCT